MQNQQCVTITLHVTSPRLGYSNNAVTLSHNCIRAFSYVTNHLAENLTLLVPPYGEFRKRVH